MSYIDELEVITDTKPCILDTDVDNVITVTTAIPLDEILLGESDDEETE